MSQLLQNNKSIKVTNNHRENYAQFNKSDIFNTTLPQTSYYYSERKPKPANFQPKYKDQTAFTRRMKEFYSSNEYNENIARNQKASKNVFTKEIYGEVKKNGNDYDPKIQKLKELNPGLKEGELKTLKRAQTEKDLNCVFRNEKKGKQNLNSRFNNLKSNIFHDQEKEQMNSTFKPPPKEVKKREKTPAANSTKTGRTNISTNMNWMKQNTQILFKDKNCNEVNLSPNQKKHNFMNSTIFGEKKYLKTEPSKSGKLEVVDPKEDFKNTISEFNIKAKGGKKLQKSLELASCLHPPEFYKNNLGNKNQDCGVEHFKLQKSKCVDTIDINEVKKAFSSRGLHLYGLDARGDAKDNLAFNIRFTKEDEKHVPKLNEIKDIK